MSAVHNNAVWSTIQTRCHIKAWFLRAAWGGPTDYARVFILSSVNETVQWQAVLWSAYLFVGGCVNPGSRCGASSLNFLYTILLLRVGMLTDSQRGEHLSESAGIQENAQVRLLSSDETWEHPERRRRPPVLLSNLKSPALGEMTAMPIPSHLICWTKRLGECHLDNEM